MGVRSQKPPGRASEQRAWRRGGQPLRKDRPGATVPPCRGVTPPTAPALGGKRGRLRLHSLSLSNSGACTDTALEKGSHSPPFHPRGRLHPCFRDWETEAQRGTTPPGRHSSPLPSPRTWGNPNFAALLMHDLDASTHICLSFPTWKSGTSIAPLCAGRKDEMRQRVYKSLIRCLAHNKP